MREIRHIAIEILKNEILIGLALGDSIFLAKKRKTVVWLTNRLKQKS